MAKGWSYPFRAQFGHIFLLARNERFRNRSHTLCWLMEQCRDIHSYYTLLSNILADNGNSYCATHLWAHRLLFIYLWSHPLENTPSLQGLAISDLKRHNFCYKRNTKPQRRLERLTAPGPGAEQELTSPGCTFPSLWCLILVFSLIAKQSFTFSLHPHPGLCACFGARQSLFCSSEWSLAQGSSELSWGLTIGINIKWLEWKNKQQWQQGLNNLHLFKQNGDGGMQAWWYFCLFIFLWK